MTNLYIICTPYQLLICIAKTLLAHREGKDELIVSNIKGIEPQWLRNAGSLFSKTVVLHPTRTYFHVLLWKNRLSRHIRFCNKILYKFLGIDDSFFKGKEVFVFNDFSAIGCLLNAAQIEYNLIEDGLNRFQHSLASLFPSRSIFSSLWDSLLGVSWKALGQSKYTKSIEVNDSTNLCIEHPNIIVSNRNHLFSSLTEKDIDILANIFGYQPLDCGFERDSTLLLTQPLSEDHLISHSSKISLYRHLVKQYGTGKLYIKPHPREHEDYGLIFPEAMILKNSSIPFEICQLKDSFHFKRIITAFSTAIDAIICADEKIQMGQEWTLHFSD